MNLTSLLLYSLNAPTWTARKLDKKATEQVKESNGVKEGVDAGNFHKLLLPDCPELDKVGSWIGATRTGFYLHTAPWGETRGTRVGKAENHMDFMSWFGDRRAGLDPLLDLFGKAYVGKIAEAEYQLHGLFDVTDYPPWETVRARFGINMSVQPLPNINDVRVLKEIPPHVRKEIEDNIKKECADSYAAATREAFEQLAKPIAHMAAKLRDYQNDPGTGKNRKRIHDSLTENVEAFAAAARRLNIARDPQLEALADEAEKLVCGITAKDLKDSDGFRVQKMKEAEELAERIAKFMP